MSTPHLHDHHHVTLENFEELGRNHVINSPRSIEACLRLGLDTADLVSKSVDDFKGRFIPDSVAQVKWEHSEKRRGEALKEAKQERNTIVQATSGMSSTIGGNGSSKNGHGIKNSASAPQLEMNVMSDADQELIRRTEQMLEQERARLRKAKARQEAEIKSILEHETYLVGLHHQAAISEEKERVRMMARQKEREEKAAADAIKREERRAQLQEMREQEEERMKQLAVREFHEAKKIHALQIKKEAEMKIIAKERALDRIKKSEVRKQKTKNILIELERQGDERLKKLVHADALRIKRNEEADIIRRQKAVLKREASIRRIQIAQEQADAVLEAKKQKVADKHERDRIRHAEAKLIKDKEMEEKIQARKEKDEVRAERLEAMHEEQVMRVVQFERKIREGNKFIKIVRQRKMEELAIVKAKKELMMQDKLDRIARDARIKEYKRERTLRRMEVAEERLKSTMMQKSKLIADRKAAAIGVAHRKFQMQRTMGMIRASGKWELMECLDDDGTISKKKRRAQLREMKRKKKEGGDEMGGGSPAGSPR